MLPLSFLVEVLVIIPLPMSFHATVETCSLVITVLVEVAFTCFFPLPLFEAKATFLFLLVPPTRRGLGAFPSEGSPRQ